MTENERHMTVAFLGFTDFEKLQPLLPSIPLPSFKIGLSGNFDRILFLPKARPHVAAWHISWEDDPSPLVDYIRTLSHWLREAGFHLDERETFLPHVTLCRSPFNFHEWRLSFQKLPLFISTLHLYESLGQLQYRPVWTHQLKAPFEEISHTADLAFKIRGESLEQLFLHAFNALAFKSPALLKYRKEAITFDSIDEVIMHLNEIIAHADAAEGVPFKAVSFHGEVVPERDIGFSWEMIVDV